MSVVFKISPSSCGDILGGSIGLSDSQAAKLNAHEARKADPKAKPLTANMEAERLKLIEIRDNPQPTQGMKTHCEKWLKERVIYKRRKQVNTKGMTKGDLCEDAGIKRTGDKLGALYIKNETTFENEYCKGTPDICPKIEDLIIDVKNSEDYNSFPLFATKCPDSNNEPQVQCYMWLTGKTKAIVSYTLENAPVNLIYAEAKSRAYFANLRKGFGEEMETADDHYEAAEAFLTYEDVDPKHRIKLFYFDRNEAMIEEIKRRILMCREYIKQLQAVPVTA